MSKLGVRSLLFLALSMSAALPVALLGVNQAERWQRAEVQATDRQALAAARAAADQVSGTMLDEAHATESLAAQVAAVPSFEPAGLRVALSAHVRHHPEVWGAYVADATGTSLLGLSASGQVAESRVSYRDRDYFREILATGRTAISRVQVGRLTRVGSVSIASPISDSAGRLLGIVCTSLDLASIAAQAKTNVRGMADGRLVLIDAEGRVIADSNGRAGQELRDLSGMALFAKVAADHAVQRQGLDESGRAVRAVAVGLRAPVSGWHVVATTPKSTVDAHGRQVRNQTALLALALIFAALGLSAWLASWLARPLRALAATADAVTRGQLETAPPPLPPHAPREVQQLTSAIGSMLHELRRHSLELEDLVAKRTLELSRANGELEGALLTIRDKERHMAEDIAKARLFQERMLPPRLQLRGLQIATHYAPLESVSGDIYDLVQLPDGRLRVFLVDAVGHGVQASMRTILLKSTYDRLKLSAANPSELLARLNESLVAEFPDGELHSEAVCLDLVVASDSVEVSYANAGNTPLFVLSAVAAPREHYAGGPLLGVESLDWSPPERFLAGPGELLVICSDGLLEQLDQEWRRFDSALGGLRLDPAEDAEQSLARLMAAFDAFRGARPVADDVTVIGLRASHSLDADERRRQTS